MFRQAETLFAAEKHAEALTLYERAIAANPALTRGYRGIVQCYKALGDTQGAVVFMETLFLENPDSPNTCYGLGYALYSSGKCAEAQNYFEKAIALKPDFAAAWNNSAAIYHFIDQDYERARQYYQKAIELSKKTKNEWVLSVAEKNLANLPAREDLQPLTLEEFINTFIAKAEAGDRQKISQLIAAHRENSARAMDWFLKEAMRAGAAKKNDVENTTLVLASLLAQNYYTNFHDAALKDRLNHYATLDEGTKKDTIRGDDLLQQAQRQELNGHAQQALSSYREALASFKRVGDQSKSGEVLLNLGDLYRKQQNYAAARQSYSDALTCFIGTGEEERKALALSSLGIASYLSGRQDDALDFFYRSLAIYKQLNDQRSADKVQKNIALIKGP